MPHKDYAGIAPSDFLSDETKNAANTGCIREAFCKLWRKIRKQGAHKAVRRSLCGVALAFNLYYMARE